ncbi:MAG: hypothetical protein II865_07300 [Bacteroidales bacterium]|nr:hypothetical protein [Bacteroidales bacterium]
MKGNWIGILLLLMCMIASKGVQAQNFEDVFNAFANQNQQTFDHFSDSINRKFAALMESNMRAFTGEKPKISNSKPKPDKLPQVHGSDRPVNLPKPTHRALEQEAIPILPEQQSESPLGDRATPSAEEFNILDFTMFGENVRLARRPFPKKLNGITAKDVSEFWIQLSECDYEPMLKVCAAAREENGFNDWATYQLVLELTRQTYPRLYDEQVVMVVFLLNQLGMEAKVGFDNAHLFCLLAVEQQLYGLSFADIANTRYFILEVDSTYLNQESTYSFSTYDIAFPEHTQGLDMNVPKPLKSVKTTDMSDTAILFSMNMVELFSSYPQVDIVVYANAHPSEVFCQSIDHVFSSQLKNRTEYDAVAFLLSYMHYGFDYATDEAQFGHEKPFFCEENYYYPKNDCDDRAILFSFLVRYLLGLEVVLIEYPGHVASAVHFHDNVSGEFVEYNGLKYVICDPAYIGARVGEEMPEYTPADRIIIPL